jgi:hypothetical protein
MWQGLPPSTLTKDSFADYWQSAIHLSAEEDSRARTSSIVSIANWVEYRELWTFAINYDKANRNTKRRDTVQLGSSFLLSYNYSKTVALLHRPLWRRWIDSPVTVSRRSVQVRECSYRR